MRDRFTPTAYVLDQFDVLPLGSVLREEVSMYQASPAFVHDVAGPLTRKFLSAAFVLARWTPEEMLNSIIDVRVHQLQAGYYPAIPGYHLDWMPRKNKGADVDLSVIPERKNIVLIVGETSLTEFVDSEVSYLGPNAQFKDYNVMLKRYAATHHVESGQLVHFTSEDWHRPVPAEGNEWRYLARISTGMGIQPANQVRSQSQVYIPIEEGSF